MPKYLMPAFIYNQYQINLYLRAILIYDIEIIYNCRSKMSSLFTGCSSSTSRFILLKMKRVWRSRFSNQFIIICIKEDAVELVITLSCQNNRLILLHTANVWTLSSSNSWCVSNIIIWFIQYITENLSAKFNSMSFPVLVFWTEWYEFWPAINV